MHETKRIPISLQGSFSELLETGVFGPSKWAHLLQYMGLKDFKIIFAEDENQYETWLRTARKRRGFDRHIAGQVLCGQTFHLFACASARIVRRMPSLKALRTQEDTVEQSILAYSEQLSHRAPMQRASSLTLLALCSLKHLILKGESDSLRLSATKTLLDLPLVQARLGALTRKVEASYHKHSHVHVEGSLIDQLTGLIDKGESREIMALLTENSSETPAIPLETNENP